MKRLLTGLVLVLLSSTLAFAGTMVTENIVNATGVSPIWITRNSTTYSHSFPMKSAETFALTYQIVSAGGTPNATMQFEQSYQLPATEGASDLNWTVPRGMADIATINTTELVVAASISPIALPYGRVKIVDNVNSSDTNVTLKLSVIEK